MKTSRTSLVLVGFFVALLTLVAIAINSARNITHLEDRANLIDHTHRVIFALEETMSLVKDAESGARGYYITGQQQYLVHYRAALDDIPGKLLNLKALTLDNPVQRDSLQNLTRLVSSRVEQLKAGVQLRDAEQGEQRVRIGLSSGAGAEVMEQVRKTIDQMQEVEEKLLAERSRALARESGQVKTFIVLGNVVAFFLLCSAFWALAREIKRRRVSDAALKQANRALQQNTVELRATNKELESFSYSISHDLRIPLRAVDGYAHMLQEDYDDRLDADGKRMLAVIRENSTRMGALIDDLLAFSRLGRTDLMAAVVDMEALVNQVLDDLLEEDNPVPRVTVGELPAAWADRSLMRQVWVNLISNAIKYSAASEAPVISISGTTDDEETIYSVTDNGAGFDMQYYDKLFGVFQRLHSADEYPGTGVGLAIVQRVITRHGGRVWAQGEVGHGATFHFALPREGASND